MTKFSISSKSGRIRAESDDGETLRLFVNTNGSGFDPLHTIEVPVKLADLRQIVAHFDWLQDDGEDEKPKRTEQTEHVGLTLEIDPETLAAALAKPLAKQIAKSIRLDNRK